MRIGIDLRMCSYTGSGFSRLARNIANSILLYGDCANWTFLTHGEEFDGFKIENINIARISTALFSSSEGAELEEVSKKHSLDLLHLPFSLYPENISCPVILTISDLSPIDYPETVAEPYRKHYQQGIIRAKNATLVHVLSNEIKETILERKLLAESLVKVVNPISPFESKSYFSSKTNSLEIKKTIHKPYILSVGTVSPRKNYLRALRILEKVWERDQIDFKWIIAGWDHEGDSIFKEAISTSRFKDNISILCDICDDYLTLLYRDAICLLSCSVHEGFYFPALEALNFNCPVISPYVPALAAAGVTEIENLLPNQLEKSPNIMAEIMQGKLTNQTREIRGKVSNFYNSLSPKRFVAMYQEAFNLLNQR